MSNYGVFALLTFGDIYYIIIITKYAEGNYGTS